MKRLTMTSAILIALALPFAAYAQHDHSGHQAPTAAAKIARADEIFTAYEHARQALIKESLPEIKTAAKQVEAAARTARQQKIAELATALEKATDIKGARAGFATLSNEVIAYRASRSGDRPVVVYCSMEKKSWLQPHGEIGNPYVGPGMRKCGEIKD